MILDNGQNRKIIFDYLNKVSENDFIEEIIIPLFSSRGYTLLRVNSHSAGEKGKDIIFYRHIDLFQDLEYVVIQAKAKIVNTKNVREISDQIIRALKTPFRLKSGMGNTRPNYVILMNARRHTNDAVSELPDLVENNQNIKILFQENVSELIIKSDIAPNKLLNKLALKSKNSSNNESDRIVREIILNNKPREIEELYEHKLKLLKDKISDDTKALIIDYIFNLWGQDMTREGVVRPLRWLSMYFGLIQEKQFQLLSRVLEVFTSPIASDKAKPYTMEIVNLMKIEHFKTFIGDLIFYCALSIKKVTHKPEVRVLFNALSSLLKNKLIKDKTENEEAILLAKAFNTKIKGDNEEFNNLMKEFNKLIWTNNKKR